MDAEKKKVLTPEMRKLLLGLSPFSPEEIFEWTPKKFSDVTNLPSDLIPSYLLTCFNSQERDNVMSKLKQPEDLTLSDIKGIIRSKVHGFKQVYDVGRGLTIEFDRDPISDCISIKQLDELPKLLIEEIFYYLIHASGIMDTEKLGLR